MRERNAVAVLIRRGSAPAGAPHGTRVLLQAPARRRAPGASAPSPAASEGVVLSGGPRGSRTRRPAVHRDLGLLRDRDLPVLGVCYGMQELARAHGGSVVGGGGEYGRAAVTAADPDHPLLRGMGGGGGGFQVWMSHGDRVEGLPPASGAWR